MVAGTVAVGTGATAAAVAVAGTGVAGTGVAVAVAGITSEAPCRYAFAWASQCCGVGREFAISEPSVFVGHQEGRSRVVTMQCFRQ